MINERNSSSGICVAAILYWGAQKLPEVQLPTKRIGNKINRNNRTEEALRQIDRALQNARDKLNYLREILKGTEHLRQKKKK